MSPSLSLEEALRLTGLLLGIGTLVRSLDRLWNWRLLRSQAALGWPMLSTWRGFLHRGTAGHLFALLFSCPGTLALVSVDLVAAVILIGWWDELWLRGAGVTIVLGVELLLRLRLRRVGFTGADNMRVQVAGALWLLQLAPGRTTSIACLAFIAAQCALSYSVAGWAKLRSPGWSGQHPLYQVLRAPGFGEPALWRLFLRHPWLDRNSACAVMAFEVLFPLALFDSRLAMFFLALGLLFHLLIAWGIGLNHFVWAWLATYPAVYCSSLQFQRFLSGGSP